MSNALAALDLVAKLHRKDDDLLRTLAQVSKPTRQSAFEASAIAMVEQPLVAHWVGNQPTVREFTQAALARDPFRTFHAGSTNMIPEQGFGNGAGNITARSLLLGRFTATTDLLYGADNYRVCLGLDTAQLQALSGKKVLDVGCGDSIFPAEAHALFNIDVQGVDLHAQDDDTAKDAVFSQYVKNLVFTQYIAKVRRMEPPDGVGQAVLRLTCLQNLNSTRCRYMGSSPTTGDATHLQHADNQFDCALSSWTFMYLSNEQAVQALQEMVRVTKPGGLIRICEGFSIYRDPGMGLPTDLKGVKGSEELNQVENFGRNPGGLRVFKKKK